MITIIVADPHPNSQRLICECLNSEGFRTVTASTGQETVRLLGAEPEADIIISEIQMPVMSGFNLMSYLKVDLRHSIIPVIICSSVTNLEEVKKALDYGASDFIAKPIDPKALIAKIRLAEKHLPGAVVVVDDEAILRSLLCTALKRDGIKAIPVASGTGALDLIERERVQVVLSDVVMPEMSGLELLVEMKHEHPEIPVVLMTGVDADFSRDRVLAAGADGFIAKPFKNTEILNQLRRFMVAPVRAHR